jgi:hypothetical protein
MDRHDALMASQALPQFDVGRGGQHGSLGTSAVPVPKPRRIALNRAASGKTPEGRNPLLLQ